MSTLTQYLFAIGTFQGVLLALLLVLPSRITVASRILGVWSFLLGGSFLGVLIIVNDELSSLSFLVGWTYFLPASFGALFYLYCRYAITEERFKQKDLLHFLPFILCYLLNLDILFAPLQTKLDLIRVSPPQTISFIFSQIIFFGQAIVYIGLSILLIRRNERKATNELADFHPLVFEWLWKITWLNGAIWLLKIISTFASTLIIFSRVADALIVIFIYSIALTQWRYPHMFNIGGLVNSDKAAISNEEKKLNSAPSNKSSALDEDSRVLLLKALKDEMETNQTYLRSKLTLHFLAESLGVSSHHLSEVLNQQEGKNFYQFINQYRIEHICKELKRDSSQKIIDLAFSSGFSSKSTFNAVFKQLTGKTPSQFKSELD